MSRMAQLHAEEIHDFPEPGEGDMPELTRYHIEGQGKRWRVIGTRGNRRWIAGMGFHSEAEAERHKGWIEERWGALLHAAAKDAKAS